MFKHSLRYQNCANMCITAFEKSVLTASLIFKDKTYNLSSTCCGLDIRFPSWSRLAIFLPSIRGYGEPPIKKQQRLEFIGKSTGTFHFVWRNYDCHRDHIMEHHLHRKRSEWMYLWNRHAIRDHYFGSPELFKKREHYLFCSLELWKYCKGLGEQLHLKHALDSSFGCFRFFS